MEITLNIRLASSKDPNYTFNVDLDSEGRFNQRAGVSPTKPPKTELGAVKRPDADKLRMIKHPELQEEEDATEAVMDKLELE